ncbi:MAG: efflux RND transporter periplasmic adaptor subunit [Thermoguttaceae bacterium]
MRAILILLVVLAAIGSCAAYYTFNYVNVEPPPSFRTATVKRDTLLVTIGATGTAEPEDLIDVGAQVTGRVLSFGVDPHDPAKRVDYGTAVEDGTVLAEIDPTIYQAQVNKAVAALVHAKADLVQLQAKADQTEQEWKRAQSLRPQKAIADTDYDLARANWQVNKANVDVGRATIQQCEADLSLAQTNLNYTKIISPVKGVVIRRRVNLGQTVVAAMSAQPIFLVATDLRKIQVWASVNEADIGRIRAGQPARFTVDTYPGEVFEGKVLQVRLAAQMTQNVVTYTVVVGTDNPPTPDHPNGKILPFMTTNVKFEIDRRSNVLLAPNAALRWKPQDSEIVPEQRRPTRRESADSVKFGSQKSGPDTAASPVQRQSKRSGDNKHLWVKDGDFVRRLKVKVGQTDGALTEVSGEGLTEGMEVVIGKSRDNGDDGADAATKNPFMPQIRHGAKK